MKKYLQCLVTRKDGSIYSNPLKLSEAYLISQLAQENEKVSVKAKECTKGEYESMFV